MAISVGFDQINFITWTTAVWKNICHKSHTVVSYTHTSAVTRHTDVFSEFLSVDVYCICIYRFTKLWSSKISYFEVLKELKLSRTRAIKGSNHKTEISWFSKHLLGKLGRFELLNFYISRLSWMVQLWLNETTPLLNKYYWNEGTLNGDSLHQKCC